MSVFPKICCCTWAVSCRKFVQYIRMLCSGRFILVESVCNVWILNAMFLQWINIVQWRLRHFLPQFDSFYIYNTLEWMLCITIIIIITCFSFFSIIFRCIQNNNVTFGCSVCLFVRLWADAYLCKQKIWPLFRVSQNILAFVMKWWFIFGNCK